MPFYTKCKAGGAPDEQDVNTMSDEEKELVQEAYDFEQNANDEGGDSDSEKVSVASTGDVMPLKKLLEEETAKEWIETFDIISDVPIAVQVDDDTRRELAFETAALNSVSLAIAKFKKIKYQYRRPDDYFVEMQKPDNHMHKVRAMLEKQRYELMEKEQRRHRKYMKRLGKHTEAQVMQERHKMKRETLRKVAEFKEKRKRSNYKSNEEFAFSDDDEPKAKRGPGKPKSQKKGKTGGRKNPSTGKKTKAAKSKRHGKARRKGGR
jgi:hypothetical protein|mmetsp:Transcript_20090/g.34584  ORF Transcript_20090/g.34584 Transcript_20090/m.34584 type:complete len:264 (-) Transcript_20090:1331-2122(-)|eukprot:CAMPEP_0174363918 /NCGR_PEP_ID=MMETSP0811_2-20130205/70788_1 /TAXON_ID=73025 ORGANISM="Eutreptiella gymnastica-like, Strain CCMP1594" /NCGR_SAMPLE_ID=MMETSP0811_2 /ASSEMBLY_ACC=CAM_ASM_000667 /LENGTH=263 /DNA_ID=CAMNT_0015503069 /DNA_START=44 /DNA_END=835 /DNA_ORIENTATION=-